MKIQMIRPSSIDSSVNDRRMAKNASREASTCEGPPTKAHPSASLQQEQVREWIQCGIAVEREILQKLLAIPSADKSNRKVSIETTHDDSFVLLKTKKAAEKTQGREKVREKINIPEDKENATSIGQVERLDIRLPFVDWKAILSKAIHTQTCSVEEFENRVSDIVQEWLCVLAQLGQHEALFFSSATSFRSQIYRRLTLLLVGLVGTIGSVSERNPMDKDESTRIVKHTLYLARKILKVEGSDMKKKTSHDAQAARRTTIEADGIYHYCFFTAIAAECWELLDDSDKAMLAYKSIRAMQDRQKQCESNSVVYASFRIVPPVATYASPIACLTKTPANTPTRTPTSGSKPIHEEWNNYLANTSCTNRRNSQMIPFRENLETINSKIGNDLVLPGTLEERILRCSGED